jgi:hypothetical protein
MLLSGDTKEVLGKLLGKCFSGLEISQLSELGYGDKCKINSG